MNEKWSLHSKFFCAKVGPRATNKEKKVPFPSSPLPLHPLHPLANACYEGHGLSHSLHVTQRSSTSDVWHEKECTWMVSTLKLVMRKMNCSRKKRIKKHTCKPKRNETKNILTIKRGKEETHLEFSHQSALRIGNWAYARAPNSYTLKYPPPPPGIGTGSCGSKEKSANYVKQS